MLTRLSELEDRTNDQEVEIVEANSVLITLANGLSNETDARARDNRWYEEQLDKLKWKLRNVQLMFFSIGLILALGVLFALLFLFKQMRLGEIKINRLLAYPMPIDMERQQSKTDVSTRFMSEVRLTE